MKETDEFVFFWGGPFSQWYESDFTTLDFTYNCTEQWMMACKARLFQDAEVLKKILDSNDPKKQKALGRQVKGFDEKIWNGVCVELVTCGNIIKFQQNLEIKKILLDTGDKEIVEASPFDKIWGIGLRENDPRCLDKTKWEGENKLGICLMKAREYIRNEEKK